jgi:hypothetical protein
MSAILINLEILNVEKKAYGKFHGARNILVNRRKSSQIMKLTSAYYSSFYFL